MIVGGAKSQIIRPKSSQRGGIINTWYLKVKENVDFYNNAQQNPPPKPQQIPNFSQEALVQNQIDLMARLTFQPSLAKSRSGSNIRQNGPNSSRQTLQKQIFQQYSAREQTSPMKKYTPNAVVAANPSDEFNHPQQAIQKQKRPPSQLMHILQNQKKNIRQLYALQLSGSMQQEDNQQKNQMRDIKEKLLRVSQERNRKINNLIQEENKNNNNAQATINQNPQYYTGSNLNNSMNTSQTLQKYKNLNEGQRSSLDQNYDNKLKMLSEYQLINSSYNNNNNHSQTTNNFYRSNGYNVAAPSSFHQNIATSQNTQMHSHRATHMNNIQSQSALNRVMKQSLNQIQHGMAQSEQASQNIISIKRAQSRDQFSTQKQNSTQRMHTRTQSLICTRIVHPLNNLIGNPIENGMIPSQLNSMPDEILYDKQQSQDIYYDKQQIQDSLVEEKIEEEGAMINVSSFLNIIPLETEASPSVIGHYNHSISGFKEDESIQNYIDDNTTQRKIRQISNPSLRKKYKLSSDLLMKNFLKKDMVEFSQNKYPKEEIGENAFINKEKAGVILTDQPKRGKKKRHIKQMTVGDFKTLRGTSFENQISNGFDSPTPSNLFSQSSNISNFNDYQYNQQVISIVNRKHNLSTSPTKRVFHTDHNQKIISKQTLTQNTENSPLERQNQNNNCNTQQFSQNKAVIKLINQRPSTSIMKSNKEQIYQKLASQNIQKQGQSPSAASIKGRPGTAKVSNIAGIASQMTTNNTISTNNIHIYNNIATLSPSKNKLTNKASIHQENNYFSTTDLNSWDTSKAEDHSVFELI